MRGYPFITDLFTNVLQKSKAIEGRFTVSSAVGQEINSDTLGQVLTDAITQNKGNKKYPLSIMMPPVSRGEFKYNQQEFEGYAISMFFLKTTYYDSNNQIANRNQNTNTSMHTIPQDWHDMKRCAVSFLRVLDKVQRSGSMLNYFRLLSGEKIFRPVSNIGTDRASGVKVDFQIQVFAGCEIEDYDPNDISTINIPVADSHPEHQL